MTGVADSPKVVPSAPKQHPLTQVTEMLCHHFGGQGLLVDPRPIVPGNAYRVNIYRLKPGCVIEKTMVDTHYVEIDHLPEGPAVRGSVVPKDHR